MYEYIDKKTRDKFKKTKLGRKYNLYLLCSGSISIIFFLSLFIIDIIFGGDIDSFSEFQWGCYVFNGLIFIVSLLISCYFDGKRDGAIAQYALKEKNK